MRLERDSSAAKQFLKITTAAPVPLNATEVLYGRLLTPYAAGFVREQLKQSETLVVREVVKGQKFVFDQNECVVEISATECSCRFRKAMLLPCEHIFAVRAKVSLDLFCDLLCDR